MTNFNLPPKEDPNNPVIERKVKAFALKKMTDLFRNWKKELNLKFVKKDETPEFIGRYEKIRDHWPAFVAYKTSHKSKKMSCINKINAAKKKWHHRTESDGYLKVGLLWDKAENDLIAKGVQPATLNWVDLSRTWFFRVGGTLDPKTGKCCWTDEQLETPIMKL